MNRSSQNIIVRALTWLIDLFYIKPLRFVPLHTFRYAAMGGLNLLFNMVVYWFCFHFILRKEDTDLGFYVFSAEIMSIFLTFIITVFPGYWLIRHVALTESKLRGRTQLFRYAQVTAVNLLINIFGVKFLVQVCDFYPSIAYALVQIFTVIFSYLMQRFYSFRGHKKL